MSAPVVGALAVALVVLQLAGCAAPPPPACDPGQRQPINAAPRATAGGR